MAATPGIIQVPPDSTGKMVDVDELTVGSNVVERQRIRIGGEAANDLAQVSPTLGLAVEPKALPPGAATSAAQTTGNASLSSIDGKITAVNTGAVVVSSSALPTGAATAAKQAAPGTAGTPSTDVTTIQGAAGMTKLLVTPDSVALPANQSVNISQINAVTPLMGNGASGTGAQRVTLANDSTGILAKVTELTGGGVAHDGVDSGNPNKIGGRAISFGSNPTGVSSADRTDWLFTRAGQALILGGHPNILTLEAAYTAAQTNTAIVTIATGSKIVVVSIDIVCSNANTVNVSVRVGFGTSTTPTTTGVVATHGGIAPGSGMLKGDGGGILGVGADDEDLRITCSVPTTGDVRVLVKYFTIEG